MNHAGCATYFIIYTDKSNSVSVFNLIICLLVNVIIIIVVIVGVVILIKIIVIIIIATEIDITIEGFKLLYQSSSCNSIKTINNKNTHSNTYVIRNLVAARRLYFTHIRELIYHICMTKNISTIQIHNS